MTERHVVVLPALVDLSSVAAVRESIALGQGMPMAIDASQVQRIGGQGLQLLISAARASEAAGAKVQIDDPSPAFATMMRLTGADALPEFNA